MGRFLRLLLGVAAVWLGLRTWAALRPTAFPYLARAILDLPRPLLTHPALIDILDPIPGERILEIGPGTGYYTVPVAAALGPEGTLEILDVQQPFLDHVIERARAESRANVIPTLGDGASLPYPKDHFDAAFLVTVLGEIPDPKAALRELRRVLKPTGRLVVGEIFFDPDFSRLGWLVRRAEAAGLRFERRSGPRFAYFARFRPEEVQSADHDPSGYGRGVAGVASDPGGSEAES